MRHKQRRQGIRRKGSVLLLIVVGLTALFGIVGLALDVGQMYVTKQLAQAAADAAAQSGVMDLYNGTNTGTNLFGPGVYPCPTTGGVAPCKYAQMNGFNTASDTVTLNFNGSCTTPSGATLSSDTVNVICVTVSRVVNTTFMRVLGTNSSTVTARATAGILSTSTAVPIAILHPTLQELSISNNSTITIKGGIQRSVQVNSSADPAFSDGTIDLSLAGPNGTGGDFAVVGGPTTSPGGISLGSTGHYVSHASAIQDPLGKVNAPAFPVVVGSSVAITAGQNGCPAIPPQTCMLYSPGLYSSGIDILKQVAVFRPGIYYITGGGFTGDSNGSVVMATNCTDGPTNTCTGQLSKNGTNTGWTGNMLVYFSGGGTVKFKSNFGSDCNNVDVTCAMVGAPIGSTYQGILFFQDRTAAAGTFVDFSGGGAISISGTIYATNTLATMLTTPSHFQTVNFGGGSGSTTTLIGEIITDALSMGGNTSITMTLSSTPINNVRQVALLN
jgi:hypothetical protein